MKPADLTPPCLRADQRIMISDSVWYIPTRFVDDQFVFPGWNSAQLFGNDHPVVIEYCSGNGAWIFKKALENPDVNWVAVERKFDRVRKIWSKIKNHSMKNLIVICGEACKSTKLFFPDDSIQDIYINFPDPWPKTRHAKKRLIQQDFVGELQRILKDGQVLTFVTDDAHYSEWTIDVLHQQGGFTSLYPNPFFVSDESSYGTSYFEELWRSKGRIIRYHRFQAVKNKRCL
ncbi:MAG: tRNA (guanosine(46)-N7)-methyltransferase TrmB [Parachlamydiaceae bacterium]